MSHRVPSVDRSSDESCSSISENNGEMPFRSSSGVSAHGRVIGPTRNPQSHATPRVHEPSAHGEDSSHCDLDDLPSQEGEIEVAEGIGSAFGRRASRTVRGERYSSSIAEEPAAGRVGSAENRVHKEHLTIDDRPATRTRGSGSSGRNGPLRTMQDFSILDNVRDLVDKVRGKSSQHRRSTSSVKNLSSGGGSTDSLGNEADAPSARTPQVN